MACSPKPQVTPTAQALSAATNQLILPWHEQFASASLALYDQLERFCQNPSNAGELEAARESWQAAMLAWQQAKIINFGPIADGNLAWQIQFWPDSHNRIGRKVLSLLAGEEPINKDTIAKGVVLVQGLSALEFVLFDPQQANAENFNNPRTCDFLLAASDHSKAVSQQLLQRWRSDGGNFTGTFLSAGPNNPSFGSPSEALGALLSAVITSLENIKNKKIAEPFGGEPQTNTLNRYKLELWRSQYSLPAIHTETAAVQELLETAIVPVLEASQHEATAEQVSAQLAQLRELSATAKAPLFEQLKDPEQQAHWQTIWQQLGDLLSVLKNQVPEQINTQLGFNSNDGD